MRKIFLLIGVTVCLATGVLFCLHNRRGINTSLQGPIHPVQPSSATVIENIVPSVDRESAKNVVEQYDLEVSTVELPYLVVEIPRDGRFVISSHTVLADKDLIWQYGVNRPVWWMSGGPSPVYAYGNGYVYGPDQKEVQMESQDAKYLFTVFSDLQDHESNGQLIVIWDKLGSGKVKLNHILHELMKDGGILIKGVHRYDDSNYLLILDASGSDECSSRTTSFWVWRQPKTDLLLYSKSDNDCGPGDSYEKLKWAYEFDPATFKVVVKSSPKIAGGDNINTSGTTVDLRAMISGQ